VGWVKNLSQFLKRMSAIHVMTPQIAAGDQILAVHTLVRRLPEPIRKIIGDLSNERPVLVGLDTQPLAAALPK